MAENVSRKLACYWPLAFLFVVFAVSICEARDPYFISGFILSLLFFIQNRRGVWQLSPLDLIVIALWVWELVLQFSSINPISGFVHLRLVSQTTLYYFVLRTGFTNRERIRPLLFNYTLFLGLLALIALVSFWLFEQRIGEGWLGDIYNFRFLHNSLGYVNNVWGTFQVAFLCIIALTAYYYRHSRNKCIFLILLTLPVLAGVVRSFSRGVYIAAAFICLTLIISLLSARGVLWWKRLLAIVAVTGALLLIALPYRDEVWQTLKMTETVSQKRSIEGRLNGGQAAYEILKQHPLLGVGSGNYSQAADEYLYQDDVIGFVSLALSTFFQLPVEKGLIGTALWLALIYLMLQMLVKERERGWGALIIFISLVAVAMREATFPTLLDYGGLQLLLFTLIAIYQNNYKPQCHICTLHSKHMRYVAWFPLLFCIGILVVSIGYQHDRTLNESFIDAVTESDLDTAEKKIASISKKTPYLANRSAFQWTLFKKNGDYYHLKQAKAYLHAAMIRDPYNIQFRFDMAVLMEAAGEHDSALIILRDLVTRFPEKALYRIKLFEMLSRSDNANRKEMVTHLAKAIELAPQLLDTPLWSELACQDSAIYTEVKDRLNKKIEAITSATVNSDRDTFSGENPIKIAHYGKILFNFENVELAKSYLEEAVRQLPNLSRPWCYLGVIACERGDTILGKKYFKKSLILNPSDYLPEDYMIKYSYPGEEVKRQNSKPDSPYEFLYENYASKFWFWYNDLPLIFDCLTY